MRDLRSLQCDVIVVARSSESRTNASEGGAVQVVETVEDLPTIAGAVVASPTVTHGDVIEALLDRNVPIYTEKPLTADADRAVALATRAPNRLFVMDKWRYHPGIEALAAIARSGELGAPLGLRTIRTQWRSPHTDVDPIWILAPHDLSIALEVLGHIPEPRSASAIQVAGRPVALAAFLGEDPWHILEVSGRSPEYRRVIQLHCEGGVAVLGEGYADAIAVYRPGANDPLEGPAPERRQLPQQMPLYRELEAFVDHLRGGPPPKSSATEGAHIVSTLARLRSLAGLAS